MSDFKAFLQFCDQSRALAYDGSQLLAQSSRKTSSNHPGFHRRMNRIRSKPASRLPKDALRFIAQSPTIPFGACSPQSDQPGKPADNGQNPDEAQGS